MATRKIEKVKIKSQSGYVAYVPAKAADGYVRHGWTRADDGSSESPTEKKAEEKPKSEKKTTSRKAE